MMWGNVSWHSLFLKIPKIEHYNLSDYCFITIMATYHFIAPCHKAEVTTNQFGSVRFSSELDAC